MTTFNILRLSYPASHPSTMILFSMLDGCAAEAHSFVPKRYGFALSISFTGCIHLLNKSELYMVTGT